MHDTVPEILHRLMQNLPIQDFEPVGSQQRQKEYASLRQVALAMGLEPDKKLANRVRAAASAESAFMGECI